MAVDRQGSAFRGKSLPPRVLLALVACLVLLCVPAVSAASVGVCWGRNSWQPFSPAAVVSTLEANNIPRLKIYDANSDILRALIGHKTEVAITLCNNVLKSVAGSASAATQWVRVNVLPFVLSGVNITQLAVGDEPFLLAFNGQYDNLVVPAMQNLRQALITLSLSRRVRLTVPISADILSSSFPPSSGAFRPEIIDQVTQIAGILRATGSFFVVTVQPYSTMLLEERKGNLMEPGMALIDPQASSNIGGPSPGGWNYVDPQSGLTYGNIFDATFDAIVYALRSINFDDLPMEVGAVGWPSEGDNNATLHLATPNNAAVFNNAIVAHLLSGSGTPARPNVPLSGFLLGLSDEDAFPSSAGAFARHWGIYRSDGTPKYNVDFTGGLGGNTVQGYVSSTGQAALTPARGVTQLPQRWCVSRPGASQQQLNNAFSYLCGGNANRVDCSPVLPGGTCYFPGNMNKMVDYVMNNYYQLNGQNAAACNFANAANVITLDPSMNGCKFELGIM